MTLSSFAVLLFVVLLQLYSVTKSDNSVKCVNESYIGTVFKPSGDGVLGRYDVEWCTKGNVKATEWSLVLSYNLNKKEHNCNKGIIPFHKHSQFTQVFAPQDVNCTHMCFHTTLDMVFSGCFVLANWLPALGSHQDLLAQYITNDYTNKSFEHNIINADVLYHEHDVAVHWYLGNIVASKYDMKLCLENKTGPGEERKLYDCRPVNDNCTLREVNPHEIICKLRELNGTYYMSLKHIAPWTKGGVFQHQVFSHYTFEVAPPIVPEQRVSSLTYVVYAALALVLSVAAAALLCLWRVRSTRRWQQAILDNWRHRKLGVEEVVVADTSPRAVLLLYAREGALGEPLLKAMRELLQDAGLQVLDLYSPEVVSRSAAAPVAWLRSALERGDVCVLLLQTPALAALHGDRAFPLELGADAALINRGAKIVQAEPSPSDALLSMALRMLAEDVHTATPYKKYFLATLDTLETDTLPYVVPFRRYGVPGDAARLLRDLRRPAPRAARERALRGAARAFVRRVRARPAYLRDLLRVLE